jgi:hypothetical protein
VSPPRIDSAGGTLRMRVYAFATLVASSVLIGCGGVSGGPTTVSLQQLSQIAPKERVDTIQAGTMMLVRLDRGGVQPSEIPIRTGAIFSNGPVRYMEFHIFGASLCGDDSGAPIYFPNNEVVGGYDPEESAMHGTPCVRILDGSIPSASAPSGVVPLAGSTVAIPRLSGAVIMAEYVCVTAVVNGVPILGKPQAVVPESSAIVPVRITGVFSGKKRPLSTGEQIGLFQSGDLAFCSAGSVETATISSHCDGGKIQVSAQTEWYMSGTSLINQLSWRQGLVDPIANVYGLTAGSFEGCLAVTVSGSTVTVPISVTDPTDVSSALRTAVHSALNPYWGQQPSSISLTLSFHS